MNVVYLIEWMDENEDVLAWEPTVVGSVAAVRSLTESAGTWEVDPPMPYPTPKEVRMTCPSCKGGRRQWQVTSRWKHPRQAEELHEALMRMRYTEPAVTERRVMKRLLKRPPHLGRHTFGDCQDCLTPAASTGRKRRPTLVPSGMVASPFMRVWSADSLVNVDELLTWMRCAASAHEARSLMHVACRDVNMCWELTRNDHPNMKEM